MERTTTLEAAKEIFGRNLIGPDEMAKYSFQMGLKSPQFVPEIPYEISELQKHSDEYLLILGTSKMATGIELTIHSLRQNFGIDPNFSEPCFYNQDWYLNEAFASLSLSDNWYLIRKSVFIDSRSQSPEILKSRYNFPSAVQCAYAFFLYYFCTGKYLWERDFVWCEDNDHHGDRIYVGKYLDVTGVNKNGFSIHRYLSLRDWYGSIELI